MLRKLTRQPVSNEESLRASQEQFRSAFDDATIGMALVSTEGQFMQVNARWLVRDETGLPPEELATIPLVQLKGRESGGGRALAPTSCHGASLRARLRLGYSPSVRRLQRSC